ncbi:MAG: ABC transporter substrate binding protein [Gallionella sp.]
MKNCLTVLVGAQAATPKAAPVCARLELTVKQLGTLVILLSSMFASPTLLAAEGEIAVIYPDIGEPYRQVFDSIIQGVESKVGTSVAKFPVQSETNVAELKETLKRNNTKVAIALGRQGMQAATALNNGIGIVVGGVLTVPESEARGQTAISLAPDPALLFARIRLMLPNTRRIYVIYDPTINGWLMKLAREAARSMGIELVLHEAQDLRSAVKLYKSVFSVANGGRDVLWLPQDATTVEESTVLPMVLQESWNHNIAVFSSNSALVRRGVLFSLYPDNVGLGKSLAGLALGILQSRDYVRLGRMPLRDVQSAINLRTAKHLEIDPSRLKNFDSTFPER